ncbi:putative ABC transporter permease protein [Actinoplanes missouriensis 431]|uniref:Transport permease protein n=1 Tax=Actinoplanes missouriensis (strain ATCC 14538 / DSM 43046 / CBS 188.64 / JCM 3121 / NBRC 102363 / NCIMB 12654 / NRRL B-3342 / UNCC 431) TaxID=512565 RepID=I0HEX6_ACTM4|nr:ABC transporter permease [Actinoplanes missouriensis]BAL91563.1 putative ABC transporter permease protein [Actinoplanes missouriensis 431]
MNVFAKLVATEFRTAFREPVYLFFAALFPVVLIAILGAVPAFREPSAEFGGLRTVDVYAGIVIALSVAMIGLQGMPTVLANYREKGILRRLATTPVRPVALLGAQLVFSAITVVFSSILVFVVAGLAYGVPLPESPIAFLLAVVLAVAGVFAVGLLIASLAPSGKAANAIGLILFFPLMFLAGLYAPREVMPDVVQTIADYTPLAAGERLMHEAMTGHWPNLLSVTVLVGYLLVFGAAAAKLFRWE